MANRILIKRSNVCGRLPDQLAEGELALNLADGKLFFKDDQGFIRTFHASEEKILPKNDEVTLAGKISLLQDAILKMLKRDLDVIRKDRPNKWFDLMPAFWRTWVHSEGNQNFYLEECLRAIFFQEGTLTLNNTEIAWSTSFKLMRTIRDTLEKCEEIREYLQTLRVGDNLSVCKSTEEDYYERNDIREFTAA